MAAMRLLAVVLALSTIPLHAQVQREVRAFEQFAGTWVLDEAASTGKLDIVPRIPLNITIETTRTELIVRKVPRLQPGDRASATPPAEVYRLDQTETWRTEQRAPGVTRDRGYRFTLVADMLALTIRDREPDAERPFTAVTDAYAVDGDVLTLHRQLTAMTAAGEVLAMREDGNRRHTFLYRRPAP